MPAGVYTRTEEHKKNLRDSLWGDPEKKRRTIEKLKANSGRPLGKKDTEATRAKKSIAKKKWWAELRKDKNKLAERNKKVSESLKGKYVGDLGANWRGGKSNEKRNGKKNSQWRSSVLHRDNYTCQICFQYGGDMHVDHIKSWAEYPELRFETENGRSLCIPCHYFVTFKRKMPNGSRWGMRKKLIKNQ